MRKIITYIFLSFIAIINAAKISGKFNSNDLKRKNGWIYISKFGMDIGSGFYYMRIRQKSSKYHTTSFFPLL